MEHGVLRSADVAEASLSRLLARYGVTLSPVDRGARIPASFWGDPEAGIRGATLFARDDTPLHSVLHELGHIVCMRPDRRDRVDADAGSDDAEECAVCYLQVLLADHLAGFGRDRCLRDMDAWGYSFREGSARDWFAGDGRDARAWLREKRLIDAAGEPTWRLRS